MLTSLINVVLQVEIVTFKWRRVFSYFCFPLGPNFCLTTYIISGKLTSIPMSTLVFAAIQCIDNNSCSKCYGCVSGSSDIDDFPLSTCKVVLTITMTRAVQQIFMLCPLMTAIRHLEKNAVFIKIKEDIT